MIAVFVLAIGIIPAFYVFSRGTAGTILTRDEILAHSYASELIDYAQALGFDKLDPDEFKPKEVPSIPGGAEIQWTSSGIKQNFVLTSLVFKGRKSL